MTHEHFGRHDVEKRFPPGAWQNVVFREFTAALESEARPFPCVFGVAGFKANQLRFAFFEDVDGAAVATVLADYLAKARAYGKNTSFVALFRPKSVMRLEGYRQRFWSLLRDLSEHDTNPWPTHIPTELDDPKWEFCFSGEPVFVVCNTPAHVLRQSRRASTFMLTFQPRWVFDAILNTDRNAALAFGKVRERLLSYDMLPPSPALGKYGDPRVREYQQYFLGETSEKAKCPFASLKKKEKESV